MRYAFDDFELDMQTCELRRAGVPVALTPKAFAVLAYLIQHRDRLVTKEELLEQLWPDTYVDDSAVKRNIMAVRRAIGNRSDTSQPIKTQRGLGYRFTAAVAVYDSPPSDAEGDGPASKPSEASRHLAPVAGETEPCGRDDPMSPAGGDRRRCAACQQENRPAARLCVGCGAPLDVICIYCGYVVSPPASFCPACGQRLPVVSSPEFTSLPRPSLPPQETPPQRSAPHAFTGERKLVTVLCCTVGNAPSLIEKVGLDAMHSLMQVVYDLALTEVQQYVGTIQYVTGASFLMVFGAPVAQEDHARRAVLAAFGLQHRLREQPSRLRLPSGEDVALRMALHTGRVVMGQLRPHQPETATIVGDVTTLAVALARQAKPGTILASAATMRLVQEDVHSVVVPPLRVDEQPDPVPVYQVLHVVPRHDSRIATRARVRSPFVGRNAELALLHSRLARVEQGQGQVVGIIGEPGMGKSRLLDEFRQEIKTREVTYMRGACQSYGQAIPYLPLCDLLRTTWGITEADSPETVPDKVAERLQAIEFAPHTRAPYFLHLLGVQSASDALTGMSPDMLKAQTFEALHQLHFHYSRQRPCILAVEDLHWIDATSEAYLGALVERLAGVPILLLVSSRPGYQPRWLDKSYVTHAALQPLEPNDSKRMLHTILRHTPPGASLEPQILAKAEGNPLFLEELARAAAEQGEPSSTLVIPDTIQAVLAARIDRLSTAAKRLLQTTAVIGAEVSFSLLSTITGLPEDMLRRLLAQLQAGEFLYETQLFPESVYTFKHALTHEVAYTSLLQEQRRTLHARVVDALETLDGDHPADQVDRLAQHALGGELWDKAWRYFRQAGIKAMVRSANREAVTIFEQALRCLQHLPEHQDRCEPAIDIRLDLRNVLLRLGENGRCLDVLREAETFAEDLDDARRLGWIASFTSTHCLVMGDAARAITSGQRALALATACEDAALEVDTRLHLGQAYHARGDYRRAVEVLKRNVAFLEHAPHVEPGGPAGLFGLHSLAWLVWCLAELGAFSEGMTYGAEAVRSAEAVAHPYALVAAYGSVGLLYLRKGDLHEAIPRLERGVSLCQTAHIPLMLPTVASSLGAAYALSGRSGDALPLLEQGVAQAAAMGLMVYHAFTVSGLSEAHLLAGHLEAASAHALHALELGQNHKEEGHQAWALRLLGDIAMQRGPSDVEAAEAAYQEALTRAQALGMRPLQAHCHLGLGTLYGQLGQAERARGALSAAMALYQSMDMTFWLPRVEAGLARVSAQRISS